MMFLLIWLISLILPTSSENNEFVFEMIPHACLANADLGCEKANFNDCCIKCAETANCEAIDHETDTNRCCFSSQNVPTGDCEKKSIFSEKLEMFKSPHEIQMLQDQVCIGEGSVCIQCNGAECCNYVQDSTCNFGSDDTDTETVVEFRCDSHAQCPRGAYCDINRLCFAPCSSCLYWDDAINGSCPGCETDECTAHHHCVGDTYCDINRVCWEPCSDCNLYNDPIDGICPLCSSSNNERSETNGDNDRDESHTWEWDSDQSEWVWTTPGGGNTPETWVWDTEQSEWIMTTPEDDTRDDIQSPESTLTEDNTWVWSENREEWVWTSRSKAENDWPCLSDSFCWDSWSGTATTLENCQFECELFDCSAIAWNSSGGGDGVQCYIRVGDCSVGSSNDSRFTSDTWGSGVTLYCRPDGGEEEICSRSTIC